jgi:hypothetical protein
MIGRPAASMPLYRPRTQPDFARDRGRRVRRSVGHRDHAGCRGHLAQPARRDPRSGLRRPGRHGAVCPERLSASFTLRRSGRQGAVLKNCSTAHAERFASVLNLAGSVPLVRLLAREPARDQDRAVANTQPRGREAFASGTPINRGGTAFTAQRSLPSDLIIYTVIDTFRHVL